MDICQHQNELYNILGFLWSVLVFLTLSQSARCHDLTITRVMPGTLGHLLKLKGFYFDHLSIQYSAYFPECG